MGRIARFETFAKNNKRIFIRSANENDAMAILQLTYHVISENNTLVASLEEFNVTVEQQREMISLYQFYPNNCMIVAEFNGKIIGLLTFQSGNLNKYRHHGTIGMIVDKGWRGVGVGRTLLETMINWATRQPLIEKLCLEVLASNKNAISLYKKLGFIEEGRQVNQVKHSNGRYDDIIAMGRFIK